MNKTGYFGNFGGQFVPETLQPALQELTEEYAKFKQDADMQAQLSKLLSEYVGRPTPLFLAERLSEELQSTIYLKREDLAHTGAHKINNTIGQVLLAKYMGKKRIIAETGAGQHGVATATACALMNIECVVYMGAEDMQRQALNVRRIRLLGAEVRAAESGSKTLKDATSEAIRDWLATVENTYYVIGSVVGPAPYPEMVRDFQAIIGKEARQQILSITGALPDALVACVGGGSNAIGMFADFIDDEEVGLIGVEPAGKGLDTDMHGAPLKHGKLGIFFGMKAPLMQDEHGQVEESYSVSAGLDFPSVGPQHAHLNATGRAVYGSVTDDEALEAFQSLARNEGIIPALESAHALAYALQMIEKEPEKEQILVVNLSGRGDKDIFTVHDILEEKGAL